MRIVAKESDQRVVQISRIGFRFFVRTRIGCPPNDLVAKNVVSLNQVISVRFLLNGFSNDGKIAGGNTLVGVKNKDPGMSGFCQRVITSVGKAVYPLEMKDLGRELTGSLKGAVGASRIGKNDFIDHGSDTTKSVLDPIFFILNDHAQRDPRHAGK
jgi:hypothetical protein